MPTTFNAVQLANEIANTINTTRDAFNKKLASLPAECVENATLTSTEGSAITVADMFGAHTELLMVHNMGKQCNFCALWADSFIGLTRHIEQRCAFALSSPDDWETLAGRKRDRGWPFACVSIKGTPFARNLGFQTDDGMFLPGISALHKKSDGSVVRTGARIFGPGDDFCSIWPMFDIIVNGANGWKPK